MTRIYAAMRSGLVVVEDNGDGWTSQLYLRDRNLECIGVHPDQPSTAFVGTFDDGLYRVEIDANRERQINATSGDSDRITAVLVHPENPRRMWIGTEPSRLYTTADRGTSWKQLPGLIDLPSATEWSFPPRPKTHHVRRMAIDHTDYQRLYLGIEAGALVTYDRTARSFADRVHGARRDIHWVETHPAAPNRVYTAAGDGYAESHDRGDTWMYPQVGLNHRYVWGLAIDSSDPTFQLVSAASGANKAHQHPVESYVYRRIEDGQWEQLSDCGLPVGKGVTRPVFDTGAPGEFVALSNCGLYRTIDYGDHWESIPVEWPDQFQDDTARGVVLIS